MVLIEWFHISTVEAQSVASSLRRLRTRHLLKQLFVGRTARFPSVGADWRIDRGRKTRRRAWSAVQHGYFMAATTPPARPLPAQTVRLPIAYFFTSSQQTGPQRVLGARERKD